MKQSTIQDRLSLFQFQQEVNPETSDPVEVPDDLWDHLSGCFPPVDPKPTDDLRDLMYRAGQYSVIAYLSKLKDVPK